FDAGYGTWYLEDLVGKKKAKEIWFCNPKISAREALQLGLINRVVPDARLREETRAMALEIAERGAFALASIKAAFNARHGGVAADLAAKGLAGGDRVSIWLSSRIEAVIAFLACSRQGYACNPSLHRAYTPSEVAQLIDYLKASALITEPSGREPADLAAVLA